MKNSENSQCLVTGSAGFIGHNLCKRLLGAGHTVYAVDNFVTGHKENIEPFLDNKNFHFFDLDINSGEFLKIFSEIHVDKVFHLACPTGVPNIQKLAQEMLHACSYGTFNVLEVARIHHSKVLFSSSCEIYGAATIAPQREDYTGNVDPIGPRSSYEEGKRFSESIIKMYVNKYDVDAKIVRFFNIYGPGMSLQDTRVLPSFLKSIKNGEDIIVYGDGSQTRTFLFIDDLIDGLLIVMKKGEKGMAYNIGTNRQVSIRDLALMVINVTQSGSKLKFTPHFIADHQDRLPSLEKISTLQWEQKITLEEGIQKMAEFYNLCPKTQKETVGPERIVNKLAQEVL